MLDLLSKRPYILCVLSYMTKILHLTLKKPQFQVTISREKRHEFRRPSDWIKSRLVNKSYDFIKFTNGYLQGRNNVKSRCFYKWNQLLFEIH